MNNEYKPNCITITYLSKVSFASLNGADKEIDNINPIKKVTLPSGEELPYVSSQAIRRALRDKIAELGISVSPVQVASEAKGAAKTSLDPVKYIDDDLFGYMDAKGGDDGAKGTSTTRTSPIRVESLVALTTYKGDMDFGTNFMGKSVNANPNIFETEIHSGIYRGTILIELDRIGCGAGFTSDNKLSQEERAKRVIAFIDAFQNLWSSGRQTRFLADISPKFIAAAYMKSKNPIFLEAVQPLDNGVDIIKLKTVNSDYAEFIENSVFAAQEAVFTKENDVKSLKEGFAEIKGWIKNYYKEDKKVNDNNGN
ncbi:MAG TPA: type I-B CRISPR-associated protein Cas7/Cst2/DevR [Clostridiales bacterium]|nr:type I-B CRISPR-associated protein Cas7/Cst2/DevR [Clostridiales bacterium]